MNAGEREELARLLPPVDHDLPEGRHRLLKEFVMTEVQKADRPRRLFRPAVFVPVLAAAAALAVAVPAFLGGGRPAYAIADNPDGTISITINEMKNPEALEDDLKDRGHDIEVDYVPQGKQCSPKERSQSWASQAEQDKFSPWPPQDSDEPKIVIDPSVLKEGQTGVMMFSVSEPSTGGMIAGTYIRVSNGPVAECVLVDSDGAPLDAGS